MNARWVKYGCTKCDNYSVLTLTVNFSDSKSSFQSSYITKYGVKNPAVAKEEGGSLINAALSNGGTAGPKYLIKPDKTFKKNASDYDISSAGLKAHVCLITGVDHGAPAQIGKPVHARHLSARALSLSVEQQGVYAITIFSASGKKVVSFNRHPLVKGTNTLSFATNLVDNGIYLLRVSGNGVVVDSKMVVR